MLFRSDYQTYYWTLSQTQMRGWWILNDTQRKQIFDMAPAQRTAMWNSIEGQMNGQAAAAMPAMPAEPATADAAAMPAMPAMPAQPSMPATAEQGTMSAPPAEAMNKVYPMCSKTLRDSCRNRGGK